MILRVLNENNEVIHDCRELGCSVSWDGFALRDIPPDELHPDEKTRPPNLQGVGIGKRVPGATDPDLDIYKLTGQTAKLKQLI